MKRLFFYFIFIIPFRIYVSAQNYTESDKMLYISQIWKDGITKFHSPQYLHTINWDSLYVSYLKKALETKDDGEYYLVMREFLAKLNDGHSDICYDNFLFNSLKTDFIPIDIKCIKNDYYILGVDKVLLEKIPLGSKIIELNNMPVQEYLNRYIMQYAFGMTLQDKTKSAL